VADVLSRVEEEVDNNDDDAETELSRDPVRVDESRLLPSAEHRVVALLESVVAAD